MQSFRRLIPLTAVAVVLTSVGHAHAYCRTKACDPVQEECPRDARGCVDVGPPTFWPDGKAELWVDAAGSTLRGISAADAQAALERALERWSTVRCPDGVPLDLAVTVDGMVDASETGADGDPKRNRVVFTDSHWPYEKKAAALTLVSFDRDTGAMSEGGINFNSSLQALSIHPGPAEWDLEAVMTHEVGHLLGLDHSDVPGATMQAQAQGTSADALLTLEDDDIAGVCAIYGRGNTETFAPTAAVDAGSRVDPGGKPVGCAVSPGRAADGQGWWSLLLLLSVLRLGTGGAARPLRRDRGLLR